MYPWILKVGSLQLNWALVGEPGFPDFQIFRFPDFEIIDFGEINLIKLILKDRRKNKKVFWESRDKIEDFECRLWYLELTVTDNFKDSTIL